MRKSDTNIITALVPLTGLLVYWIFKGVHYPLHDFSNYYYAGKFLTEGIFDLRVFDPYTFNQMIVEHGGRNIFANFNPNPPFTAIFFNPLSFLDASAAKIGFNIISSLLFLFSLYRMAAETKLNPFYLALLPVIFFIPIRNQILFGQSYFLLLFLLTEGLIAHQKEKNLLASVFWSIAILLKVFPVIIFFFLLLQKKWRAMSYLAIACLVGFTFSTLVSGFEIWKVYLLEILPRNGAGEITVAYTTAYQSLFHLLKILFQYDAVLNPDAIIDSNLLFYGLMISFKCTILGLFTTVVFKKDNWMTFGMSMLTIVLISPYNSSYGNILLILLIPGFIKNFNPRQVWVAFGLLFLVCNIPPSSESGFLLLNFPRLIFLICLFTLISLYLRITPSLISICCFGVIFLVADLRQQKANDPSTPVLNSAGPTLVFDYEVKAGKLYYSFWDDTGSHELSAQIPIDLMSYTGVTLQKNQIVINGKQLTDSPDRKLKPGLVNNQWIIYLSDKSKGVGFYSLRKLRID